MLLSMMPAIGTTAIFWSLLAVGDRLAERRAAAHRAAAEQQHVAQHRHRQQHERPGSSRIVLPAPPAPRRLRAEARRRHHHHRRRRNIGGGGYIPPGGGGTICRICGGRRPCPVRCGPRLRGWATAAAGRTRRADRRDLDQAVAEESSVPDCYSARRRRGRRNPIAPDTNSLADVARVLRTAPLHRSRSGRLAATRRTPPSPSPRSRRGRRTGRPPSSAAGCSTATRSSRIVFTTAS